MSKMRVLALVGVVVAVTVVQLEASEITFNGFSYKQAVSIQHNGTNLSVYAGAFLIDVDDQPFTAFCVDLDHWMKNEWQGQFAPVTTINNGLAAAYLYDHFMASVSSNDQAAGLQLAIWEVVDDYGSSISLDAGNFRFASTNGARTAAETYLAALPASLSGYTTNSVILTSGDSPRSQNLIVPEPATMVLMGLSILPLIMRRTR